MFLDDRHGEMRKVDFRWMITPHPSSFLVPVCDSQRQTKDNNHGVSLAGRKEGRFRTFFTSAFQDLPQIHDVLYLEDSGFPHIINVL